MATCRSRSRSPLKQKLKSDRESPAPSNASHSSKHSEKISQRKKMHPKGFDMKMANIPNYWSWHQVSDYVKQHTDPVDLCIGQAIQHIKINYQPDQMKKECIIIFTNDDCRKQAFSILKQVRDTVDWHKLYVTLLDAEDKPENPFSGNKFTKPYQQHSQGSQFNGPGPKNIGNRIVNAPPDGDEGNIYGLSMDYLRELGIMLPLTRKVFVTHLSLKYDNEAKISNLFGLAGNVINVEILFRTEFNCARVEFDHPVEAVQAVSMFNGKELFGMPMRVKIDPLKIVLPEGLHNHGAGLGPNGVPMRGVRATVEVRTAKTEMMNEIQKLHEIIDELRQEISVLQQAARALPPPANQNPLAALGHLLQPMQLLQGLLPQNQGNDLAAMLQALAQNMSNNNWQIAQPDFNGQIPLNMQGPVQGYLNNNQGSNNICGPPNNILRGPGNCMQGPGNNMQGPGNNMQGPGNNMQGPGNNMQGLGNNMHGPGNNMQGPGNNMQGPGNNMQGPGNNMQGLGNNMHGPGNNMQGPGNNMQGPGNNMQGPGNNMQGPGNNMQRPGNNMQGPGNNMNGPWNKMQGAGNMQGGPQNPQQDSPNSCPQGQNNAGFNMPSGSNMDQNRNSNRQNEGMGSGIVLFKNLPPTVPLEMLQMKMNEVGEVKLVEMTGPGRAIVNFFSDYDADKCLQLFHQSTVDGQVIEVRKV